MSVSRREILAGSLAAGAVGLLGGLTVVRAAVRSQTLLIVEAGALDALAAMRDVFGPITDAAQTWSVPSDAIIDLDELCEHLRSAQAGSLGGIVSGANYLLLLEAIRMHAGALLVDRPHRAMNSLLYRGVIARFLP